MTLTDIEKTALARSLRAFEGTKTAGIEADDIEHVFAAFQYLAESAVGLGLHRVGAYIDRVTDKLDVNGNITGDDFNIVLRSRFNEGEGEPQIVEFSSEGRTWILMTASLDRPNIVGARSVALDLIAEDEDDLPQRIASSKEFPDDDGTTSVSGHCRIENFDLFLDFCNSVRGAMAADLAMIEPWKLDPKNIQYSMMKHANHLPMIELDGNLPGRLTRMAADRIRSYGTKVIATYIGNMLPAIVEGAISRGITWGESYLLYNDHDNKVTAIPSTLPNRVALFHQNISMISDYNTFVIWADLDENRKAERVSITALFPHDKLLIDCVTAIQNGETPTNATTLHLDLSSGELDYKDFFITGGVASIGHYVSYDYEEIVDGNMDSEHRAMPKLSENLTIFSVARKNPATFPWHFKP